MILSQRRCARGPRLFRSRACSATQTRLNLRTGWSRRAHEPLGAAPRQGPPGHAAARGGARVPARDAEAPHGRGGRGGGEPPRADRVARFDLQRPPFAQGERPHRRAGRSATPSPATTRISAGTTTSSAAPAAPSRTCPSRRSRRRRARASPTGTRSRTTPSRCAASVRAARSPDRLAPDPLQRLSIGT